jgi:hypothetical protein
MAEYPPIPVYDPAIKDWAVTPSKAAKSSDVDKVTAEVTSSGDEMVTADPSIGDEVMQEADWAFGTQGATSFTPGLFLEN